MLFKYFKLKKLKTNQIQYQKSYKQTAYFNYFTLQSELLFIKKLTYKMIETSNVSGNTYIEFSFQKSLRKYDKQAHKKLKNNCSGNNHTNFCQHCISKVYRRNSLINQSSDKKSNLQSNLKAYHIKSRQKVRQFSQTKRKKQQQYSNNKEFKNSDNSKKPLSQSNRQYNLIQDDPYKIISNFNENLSQCKKNLFSIQSQKKQEFNMQNQLSIDKILIHSNFISKKQHIQGNFQQFQIKEHFSESKTIFKQQDSSFSNIQITKTVLIGQDLQKPKQKQNYLQQQNLNNLSIISYAYFSSCSSLSSCQSLENLNNKAEYGQNFENDMIDENKQFQQTLENQQKISKAVIYNKSNKDELEANTVDFLKIESKEQLKKQYRKQHRDRVFYNIKKVKNLEQSCSQCEVISENLKKQLQMQEKFLIQSQNIAQNQISSLKYQESVNESDELTKNIQHQNEQDKESLQISLKRERTLSTERQHIIVRQIKRRSKRINFQIEQNYKCFGRIKIIGLGNENQSICLSIRRFSTSVKGFGNKNDSGNIQIDKQKLIGYVISQRPYLQNCKSQLLNMLCDILDMKQQVIRQNRNE